VAGAVLVVLAAALFLPLSARTLVSTADGALVLRHTLDPYETFAVSYTHSVNLAPVREIFVVRGAVIYLSALEFDTFGAGMPTELEPGQLLVHLPDGGMRIEGFERPVGDLRYMVGYTSQLTLHLGSAVPIPLESLAQPGQTVHISVRRLNVLQMLRLFLQFV